MQRAAEESLRRFRQEQPQNLSNQEREEVLSLANDIQSLWKCEATSSQDRQDLVRILIEKIMVEVIPESERLAVSIHWSGGFTSRHETRRTVATFDELEHCEALYLRATELYNLACPREELVAKLNREGFQSARKGQFTLSSINALILVLRRKGMIGSRPRVSKPNWRSMGLAREIGIKPAVLTGWRHRGWVQATELGGRWIYWANDTELNRLKQLAAYPTCGKKLIRKNLTQPAARPPKLANPTS